MNLFIQNNKNLILGGGKVSKEWSRSKRSQLKLIDKYFKGPISEKTLSEFIIRLTVDGRFSWGYIKGILLQLCSKYKIDLKSMFGRSNDVHKDFVSTTNIIRTLKRNTKLWLTSRNMIEHLDTFENSHRVMNVDEEQHERIKNVCAMIVSDNQILATDNIKLCASILLFMYLTGARARTVRQMTYNHFSQLKLHQRVHVLAKNKQITLFMSKNDIKSHLHLFDSILSKEKYTISEERPLNMSARAFFRAFDRIYVKTFGSRRPNGLGPHCIRRYYLAKSFDRYGIRVASKLAGHSSLNQTSHYVNRAQNDADIVRMISGKCDI